MQLATNAFNYEVLGVAAFETVRAIWQDVAVAIASCIPTWTRRWPR